jgi:antitoxin ParD1/3/4
MFASMISLSEETEALARRVAAAKSLPVDETIREALRLLEKAEQQNAEKLEALRQAWREGIESGYAGELDFNEVKKEARARLAASRA